MKIALDLDDTINGAPDWWSFMSHLLTENGHEVHVVTHRDPIHQEYTEEELRYLDISYTKLKLTGDKYQYCVEHDIDFAVDDHCSEYYRMPFSYTRLQDRVGYISPLTSIATFKKPDKSNV